MKFRSKAALAGYRAVHGGARRPPSRFVQRYELIYLVTPLPSHLTDMGGSPIRRTYVGQLTLIFQRVNGT